MYQPLNTLPDLVLDRLVSEAIHHAPSSRVSFLASLGARIHASAIRVLFCTLAIPDDVRVLELTGNSPCPMVTQILDNPERYGRVVKTLTVQQPVFDALDQGIPLDFCHFASILGACSNLEEIVWNSPFVPPDGICEIIASVNPRLNHFICRGSTDLHCTDLQSSRTCQLKWDGPSLPLLSCLPLTSLHLSRLSQAGARALAVLLSNIGEDSLLEDVGFDIVWLDDALCEKIVEAGRRIRKLKLGTRGTKLSDRGIVKIAEGCENLEDFVLEEVQGRLTRTLWTKPSHFPAALRRFRVAINESASHHSWTADHFVSLHAIPFSILESFSLVRIEAYPRLVNGVPIYDNLIDDIACLKPVQQDFVDKVCGAKSLSILECDWWAWSIADLKAILDNCTELETIKICLDAPFSKLLSLTSNFASLQNLRELSICINPIEAPGTPPVPLIPLSQSSLPTPTGTPILKAKSVLPQLLSFDQMQTQTLPTSAVGDPSMPLMREVKRFVRKCPKLMSLGWYGKNGRGTWIVTRPPATISKISINVTVEYVPPSISEAAWKTMLRQKNEAEAEQKGWTSQAEERAGQTWTGPVADALAAERAAEAEKEQAAAMNDKERLGRLREGGRKARTLSVNISSAGDDVQLPTPTDSSHSRSPVLKYSPLSPPPSVSELSVTTTLSSVSENAESNSSNGIDHSGAHKRPPSEPSLSPTKESTHWRTLSASGAAPKDKGDHPDYFAGKSIGTTSGSGNKIGKRRGLPNGAGRGFKKRTSGTVEAESTSGHEARRGRGSGRGAGYLSVSEASGRGQTRKSSSRRSTD